MIIWDVETGAEVSVPWSDIEGANQSGGIRQTAQMGSSSQYKLDVTGGWHVQCAQFVPDPFDPSDPIKAGVSALRVVGRLGVFRGVYAHALCQEWSEMKGAVAGAQAGGAFELRDLGFDLSRREARRQRIVGPHREDLGRHDRSRGVYLCGRTVRVAI